jgi:DNA-binding PadR family transcriptional regulator
MSRSEEDLSAGEWAVLAVLAEQPTHGFEIARAMAPEGEIGKVWSLRRPHVYHAIDELTARGYVQHVSTEPSRTGPQRNVLKVTPAGRRALKRWLAEPVTAVRDARSLLMLKLLFVTRRGDDPRSLLEAQRVGFAAAAERLVVAAAEADGFDRALVRWRLETTDAAVRFIDSMLAE